MSFDTYTKAVLHFDNNLTDEIGHTITASGSPSYSTSIKVFGTHSIQLGEGKIIIFNSDDFNLSPSDYTIEFRVYLTSSSEQNWFVSSYNKSGAVPVGYRMTYSQADSKLSIKRTYEWQDLSKTATQAIDGVDMTLNAWHAFAFVRYGGNYLVFIDGVLKANVARKEDIFSSDDFYFGDKWSGSGITANIDEMRISKGIARYIANYTVATVRFGDETIEPEPVFPAAITQYKINPDIWMKQSPLIVSDHDEFTIEDEIIGGIQITNLDVHLYLGSTDKTYLHTYGNTQSYTGNKYITNKFGNLKGGNIYVLSVRVKIDGQIKTKKCEIRVQKESDII